jgi:hypothetical protein
VVDPIIIGGAALLALKFFQGMEGRIPVAGAGWWTKKIDALARKRKLEGHWIGGHWDCRYLPNFRYASWHRYPTHQAYFEEVYHSWRRELPTSAFMVAFAHCIKAQGWGKEGTKSRIPDHNNLGAWASSPQCLDGEIPFFIAEDPAIGGQAFRYFANWDDMLSYYLSRFGSRAYLMRNFSKEPSKITQSNVQAYMRSIRSWLSSKTDPDAFGAAMYGFIKRFRGREFKYIWQ